MLKQYHLSDGRLVEDTDGGEGQVLVYVSPNEQEKRHLIERYQLDEHTLNSALDPDELARIEFEPEHAALIFKRPRNYCVDDHFMFRVTSMGMFLFKDKLIIVVTEDNPLFEGRRFTKIQSLTDLLLKLMGGAIQHFLDHLKIINMVSDELEQKINSAMENRFLLNLFTLEKSLVYYLNSIHTNTVLITKITASMNKLGISPEQSEFLDDIGVENNQCYKLAEIYSNVLSGLMDARASIVSNNLNVLMKTLNIITIGIMVPTFVVSAFSMNVKIPMEDAPGAFWMIMGLALVSVLAFMLFWRIKKF